MTTPSFARTTAPSPFGKCSEEMEIPMPPALKDIITRLASFEGKAASTYVREVLESHSLLAREKVIRIVEATGGDVTRVNTR